VIALLAGALIMPRPANRHAAPGRLPEPAEAHQPGQSISPSNVTRAGTGIVQQCEPRRYLVFQLLHYDAAQKDAGAGRMKLGLVLCAAATLLAGCAADKMRSYIGQDIRAVELAYGPPGNQIDLGNGTRAFQWTKISVDTTPVSAVTTTDKDKKGRKSTYTEFVGGEQTVTKCLYTFLTTWNPSGNGWIVTGIREPSFDCAIGDLS
jgi:hypothetical protein